MTNFRQNFMENYKKLGTWDVLKPDLRLNIRGLEINFMWT